MKKRMRKLISVIGVTVLAVSLFAGCGNSDQQGSSSKSDSSASAESTGEVMSNEILSNLPQKQEPLETGDLEMSMRFRHC